MHFRLPGERKRCTILSNASSAWSNITRRYLQAYVRYVNMSCRVCLRHILRNQSSRDDWSIATQFFPWQRADITNQGRRRYHECRCCCLRGDGSRISRAYLKIARETVRTAMDRRPLCPPRLNPSVKITIESKSETWMDLRRTLAGISRACYINKGPLILDTRSRAPTKQFAAMGATTIG